MKYFTPDLLARYGSPDDTVADEAHSEWEAVTETYKRHLQSIYQELPKRLRGLLRRYHLHDARVCFVGVDNQALHLTLQLDSPPHETIFLRYRLASEVVPRTTDGLITQPPFTWLYDELDIAKQGDIPIVEQRILFSNGLELTIQFQNLSYTAARSLPLVAAGTQGPVRVEMAGY
jgi:hypothetical protein